VQQCANIFSTFFQIENQSVRNTHRATRFSVANGKKPDKFEEEAVAIITKQEKPENGNGTIDEHDETNV
jgi:hypothetical protein